MVNEKWKRSTFLTFFHAKFWIKDGEEVIVGGQNIIKFENNSTGYNNLNRDTDLLIKGPATTDFLEAYLNLWEQHRDQRNGTLQTMNDELAETKKNERIARLRGAEHYNEVFSHPESRMNGVCRSLVQKAYHRNLSIASVLEHHIAHARHSIVMTSPEIKFQPGDRTRRDRFFSTLKDSAKKGVQIEFVSNGVDGGNGEYTAALRGELEWAVESGHRFATRIWNHILNREPSNNARDHRHYLNDLRHHGVRTWTHFNYIHAKQAYFDRIATSISSLNLDTPSIERNDEAGAICMDQSLSQAMETQLTLDLVNSVPVMSRNEP
jgi:phosphatidylserine/phosphatidylglycerophosphate/cardiolipin synthase-like enzyme